MGINKAEIDVWGQSPFLFLFELKNFFNFL